MYQVCLIMLLQAHMSLNQTVRWTLSMCLMHVPGCQCTLDMCLVAVPQVLLHLQNCKGKRFVSVNMESPPPQHTCCSCSDSSVVSQLDDSQLVAKAGWDFSVAAYVTMSCTTVDSASSVTTEHLHSHSALPESTKTLLVSRNV